MAKSKRARQRWTAFAISFLAIVGGAIYGIWFATPGYQRPADLVLPSDQAEYDSEVAKPILFSDGRSEEFSAPTELASLSQDGDLSWKLKSAIYDEGHRILHAVRRNDDPDNPWSVQLENEMLEQEWIQIEYPISMEENPWAQFRPGEAVPFDEGVNNSSERKAKGGRHIVAISFKAKNESIRDRDAHAARDALTKYQICTSWGTSGGGSGLSVSATTHHWHDGDIEFVFDVVTGEPIEFDVDPSQPSDLQLPGGIKIRILGFAPGKVKRVTDTAMEWGARTREETYVIDKK
ncbi:MAG: hypothetical protein AAF585_17945, partial [Verrucomicrobiota bacterium]